MQNNPLTYLDLVVEVVRGKTPIPEYQGYSSDKTSEAKIHLKNLRQKYKGNLFSNFLLRLSPYFLNKAWSKMSPSALTMCGEKSIHQLRQALETIHSEKIPGDFIETGVWRGGLPIIMRAFLQSVGDTKRTVWVADSFKGLPSSQSEPNDKLAHQLLEPIDHLSASRRQVEKSFEYFGLKDQQVHFLEGWFKDTLHRISDTTFSLIRLDGDYYESTKDALDALYPKLSQGGYLIVDDYNLPLGCKKAVDEYREKYQITAPLIKINRQAVYWRK